MIWGEEKGVQLKNDCLRMYDLSQREGRKDGQIFHSTGIEGARQRYVFAFKMINETWNNVEAVFP